MAEEKNRILVADDDPHNMEVIVSFLENEDFDILYAPNGSRAIDLAISEKPDLILMDWEMPVINGIQAIKALQQNPETQRIPIIINTGVRVDPSDLEEALETGAVDYLQKPFHPVEFKARIRANLRIRKQHDTILELMQGSIERKDRELAALAIQAHEKGHLFSQLLSEINKLRPLASEVLLRKIGELQREINTKLNLSKTWESFTMHFEEVHPGFYDRLKEIHGELTPSELRLCAYLKINLDNKEIAMLTNVESGSVRKALTRLKKRLSLKADDNLRPYISAI